MRPLLVLAFLSLGGCYRAHELPRPPDATRLSASWFHACHITSRNELYCWGTNSFGELGDGLPLVTPRDVPFTHTPIHVDREHAYREVSAGIGSTCAIRVDGTLLCWGRNFGGVLATGDRRDSSSPTRVGDERDWQSVEVGAGFACGIHEDARMQCWGSPDDGGPGPYEEIPLPAAAALTTIPGRFRSVTSSWYRTFALEENGTLYTSQNDGTFVAIEGLGPIALVAGGVLAAFAVEESGRAIVLEPGDVDGALVPRVWAGPRVILADASYRLCMLTEAGEVLSTHASGSYAWDSGALSVVSSNAESIATGAGFACALDVEGVVTCWSEHGGVLYPIAPTVVSFPAD